MKSLESFSENVIGFQTAHAIIGHRVCPCDLFLRYNVREGKSEHAIYHGHVCLHAVDMIYACERARESGKP